MDTTTPFAPHFDIMVNYQDPVGRDLLTGSLVLFSSLTPPTGTCVRLTLLLRYYYLLFSYGPESLTLIGTQRFL